MTDGYRIKCNKCNKKLLFGELLSHRCNPLRVLLFKREFTFPMFATIIIAFGIIYTYIDNTLLRTLLGVLMYFIVSIIQWYLDKNIE